MSDEEERKVPALESYAKWRPRLKRALTWAGTAGALGKVIGGESLKNREIPILGGLAGGAALAGLGDARLEERVRADPKLKHVADRAFDEHAYKSRDTMKDLVHADAISKKADAESEVHVADPLPFSQSNTARAEERFNGVLGQLFARKDEVGHLARKQLGDLFPDANNGASYGRQCRLKSGGGTIEALFADYAPRAV